MKKTIAAVVMVLITLVVAGQDFSAYRSFSFGQENASLPYRLLSPSVAGKKFPLVIFLHGAFEKGDDNAAQLNIGGRFFLRDSIRKNYPAFVLFPQCPANDAWAYFENRVNFTTGYATDWNFPFRKDPTAVTALLLKLIDEMVLNDSIDQDRIYIAGLSQGGMGVLDIIARQPGRFAGAISMCGGGDPATARFLAGKVPLWLFHGDKDQVVPTDFSQQYFRRLRRLHANVRYTEYKDVEHNCWVKAFAEPDLASWLFAQSKSNVHSSE